MTTTLALLTLRAILLGSVLVILRTKVGLQVLLYGMALVGYM